MYYLMGTQEQRRLFYMMTKTNELPLELVPVRHADRIPRIIPVIVLTLFWSLFLFPLTGFASQDSPVADELKQKAQHAYIIGSYDEAAAINLEIAQKHPESEARRYAVQMLGTLYENNLVDIKKAIKWDREYLEKYADARQVPFYREKLASLKKLAAQEQAFKVYQSIRFAHEGDEIMVKKFEALLKENPDFLLKDKVLSELGYAYARMDKRRQSYLAFQAIASQDVNRLSSSDQIAYEAADRYRQMRMTWAWAAWAVVVLLWVAALLMKPWKQLTTRTSIRTLLILTGIWAVLTAARMPTFYSMETEGYQFKISDTAVYTLAALNVTVLLWLMLLTRGQIWKTRPRALRWISPPLTLVMTAAVLYLFIAYQPNGPEIADVFVVKYQYLIGEIRERL